MNIILKRFHRNEVSTLGVLMIEGIKHDPIFTLELPWRGNARNTSCIPEGRYPIVYFFRKNKTGSFLLEGVPSRSEVMIHQGNYLHEIRGCILPGVGIETVKPEPMVTNSAIAMNKLLSILGKDHHTITISNL